MFRKMNLIAASAVVSLIGAGMPAVAGGLGTPQAGPVVAMSSPVFQTSRDWTGGYANLQLGNVNGDTGGKSDNGFGYGIGGGYDWDFGNWVLGVGGDWTNANLGLRGGDKIDNIMRLKFRAGADLGRTMVYVTAGPAWAKAKVAGRSDTDSGWYAGVGAEYMLNDRWSVGGEVLTNKFDDFNKSGHDVSATTAAVNVSFHF